MGIFRPMVLQEPILFGLVHLPQSPLGPGTRMFNRTGLPHKHLSQEHLSQEHLSQEQP
jgi:hypothetical protein